MWLQAVFPKTLFLIMMIYSQTVNYGASGLATLSELNGVDRSFLFSQQTCFSLANVVNFDKIPREISPKKQFSGVTIKGIVPSDVNRFNIDLTSYIGNIGFHMDFQYSEGSTIFNSYDKSTKRWGKEEKYKELVIKPESEFEIIISTTEDSFKIEINDKSYLFKIRMPLKYLQVMRIEGDVMTTSVNWNGWDNVSFDRYSLLNDPLAGSYIQTIQKLMHLDKIPQGINLKEHFPDVTIKGILQSDALWFALELIDATDDNLFMLMYLDFTDELTIFNSFALETGYTENEVYEEVALKPGNEIEVIISATEESFKIEVNEKLYYFKVRMPLENVKFVRTRGNVLITSVEWDRLSG